MAHWAVLPGLAVTHKETHIEKSKSHNKRKKKDTNHVRYPTKDSARGTASHVGLSAPHDGAQLKNKTPRARPQAARTSGGKGGASGRGSNGFGGVIRTS